MILPIYAYGQPVLKKVAQDIGPDYEGLEQLIADMWETMEHANGVGLAAPQIGRSIRLFVVDSGPMHEEGEEHLGVRKVFINAEILEEAGDDCFYTEGCLSIPDINGEVERPEEITIRWQDENFVEHTETFKGLNARVIQHEYDHIEGILFIEYLKPLKMRLIKRKLEKISKGEVDAAYRMKFRK
ncbi:peptide deformylase [Neolewinella lacunae]|uniref:Peptide deformylase n=1 Tax=Neolewinella lacunae TaxID=1517758 RepID=A0A923PJQ8_9BACT|nr:peptide deformylase [Neolewinella lacunae]MBC6993830.1 peptide deformylase [Neolewinella lacunae]MDN3635279.1 peptide deformylase [Neolewinella lacunae]